MKTYESEHYLFHFNENSVAELDIENIAFEQEACFRYITSVLRTIPDFRIEYFLCDSPEEVGHFYGDDDPCNGFARLPNQIYAVYNEHIKCIGFHEDTHIISYTINRPNSPAIREGLAMYFDRKWWGISNIEWCGYFIETGKSISVAAMLDKDAFFEVDCSLSYPIMGAFTDYLISTYGITAYMEFYKKKDTRRALTEVYRKTPEELDSEFVSYVKLFRIDDELKKRMKALPDQ